MCSYILCRQILMVWVCCLEVGKRRFWHVQAERKQSVMVMTGIPMAMLFFLSLWAFALANRMRSPAVSFRPEAKCIPWGDMGDSPSVQTPEMGLWWLVYEAPTIIHPFIDMFHEELRMHLVGSRLWIAKCWRHSYPRIWLWYPTCSISTSACWWLHPHRRTSQLYKHHPK